MEEFELEPGEVVVTSVRTHLFVLLMRMLPFVFLAFVPAFVSAFVGGFFAASTGAAHLQLSGDVSRFFTGLWYLGIWTAAFSTFTRYYLTVWVITNLRIVDIKQHTFFNREVSSFMLTRVQDVTTHISGPLATLFGFGRLSVETAGQDEDFYMDGLSDPAGIRDVIMSQVAQLHHDPYNVGV